MDLIINYLAKFIARGTGNRYVSRQQLWLTNLVHNIEKQSGFSCFCLNKRPEVSGAARYRSMVENPETQCCYLNSSTSDKLFNTFVSKRTDDKDSINFIIEKQVGETASGQVYKLKANQDESNSTDNKDQQLREQQGRGASSARNTRLNNCQARLYPGSTMQPYWTKKCSLKRKGRLARVNSNRSSLAVVPQQKDSYKTDKWEKHAKRTGIAKFHTYQTYSLSLPYSWIPWESMQNSEHFAIWLLHSGFITCGATWCQLRYTNTFQEKKFDEIWVGKSKKTQLSTKSTIFFNTLTLMKRWCCT